MVDSSSDPVELAGRVTNGTAFVPTIAGGRPAALHHAEPVDGDPFGVPDTSGVLYVFAVGSAVVEVSATNVDTSTLDAVIGSVDDHVVLALSRTP